MKRRLLNLAAAISLLLCLACLFMWVRSGFVNDCLDIENGGVRASILISDMGHLSLEITRNPLPSGPRRWTWGTYLRPHPRWNWEWPYLRLAGGPYLLLPYWLLWLPTIIMPGLWLRSWWDRYGAERRQRQGRCRNCGYDLRASPQRCPECGTPHADAAANSSAVTTNACPRSIASDPCTAACF